VCKESARQCRPELADVVRLHGTGYLSTHAASAAARRALNAIEICRTSALGGHLEQCDRCGTSRAVYHSCRNRSCPKCQTLAKERWIEARKAELLPVPYFHVVFTLPHELNALARSHARAIYDLLFSAAAETLLTFGRDPKHLGGMVGVTAVLHTWGQNLSQHVHVHCVVTGGALACNEARWIRGRPRFLFPVRALSRVFRAKYLEGLRRAAAEEVIVPVDKVARIADHLRRAPWVVYAKQPFAGPEGVIAYLGRYTHRIAISNERLLEVTDDYVRFRWRDYRDHNRTKVMTLAPYEFLARFVRHVLPRGYVRIRYFGLLANRCRRQHLQACRLALAVPIVHAAKKSNLSASDLLRRLTGVDIEQCPACRQGRMRVVGRIERTARPP